VNLQRLLSFGFVVALLAACSTPATRVVLLPQADGRPSAVVVRANGGQETLSKPYQRATAAVGATGAPVVDQADPAKIRAENKSLFDLLPPAPQRYTLYFNAGVAFAGESLQILTSAVNAALSRSGSDIVVTGYTDTTGSAAQNDLLSRRRADQVRQLLIDRGFPEGRIQAVGRGERNLATPTADNVAEARNRRVTIEVR